MGLGCPEVLIVHIRSHGRLGPGPGVRDKRLWIQLSLAQGNPSRVLLRSNSELQSEKVSLALREFCSESIRVAPMGLGCPEVLVVHLRPHGRLGLGPGAWDKRLWIQLSLAQGNPFRILKHLQVGKVLLESFTRAKKLEAFASGQGPSRVFYQGKWPRSF